jgi:hypothetical protein
MRTNLYLLLPLPKILGCIAGVVAVLSFVVLAILHAQSVVTTAHVVRYEEVRSDDSLEHSFKAVYAYEAAGRTFEGRCLEIVEKPGVIGTKLAIRYVKNHPNWSSEDSIFAIYFMPFLTTFACCIMFAWYRFLLWHIKKKKPDRQPEPARMDDNSAI